jgi:hypothetical protein
LAVLLGGVAITFMAVLLRGLVMAVPSQEAARVVTAQSKHLFYKTAKCSISNHARFKETLGFRHA